MLTGKLGHLAEGAMWVFLLLTHLYASIALELAGNRQLLTESSGELCSIVLFFAMDDSCAWPKTNLGTSPSL